MNLRNKLKKRYGKRFLEILNWSWNRISKFTLTRNNLEISAVIRGDKGEYACYIGENGISCSCVSQITHPYTPCKHLVFLVLFAYFNLFISTDKVEKLLLGG